MECNRDEFIMSLLDDVGVGGVSRIQVSGAIQTQDQPRRHPFPGERGGNAVGLAAGGARHDSTEGAKGVSEEKVGRA